MAVRRDRASRRLAALNFPGRPHPLFPDHGIADPLVAQHQAIITIGRIVRREAFVMSYSDVFLLIGIGLVLSLLATLALKKAMGGSAAGAH